MAGRRDSSVSSLSTSEQVFLRSHSESCLEHSTLEEVDLPSSSSAKDLEDSALPLSEGVFDVETSQSSEETKLDPLVDDTKLRETATVDQTRFSILESLSSSLDSGVQLDFTNLDMGPRTTGTKTPQFPSNP